MIAGGVLVAANGTTRTLASACGVRLASGTRRRFSGDSECRDRYRIRDAPLQTFYSPMARWRCCRCRMPMFAGLVSPARPA